MAHCESCGTQVQEKVRFCPNCGSAMKEACAQKATDQDTPPMMPETGPKEETQDAQNNKVMGILAYVLFLIPLLNGAYKTSDFVKFHINQGVLLWAMGVAYGILSAILRAVIKVPYDWGFGVTTYYTPGWLSAVLWLISVPIFIFAVIGILSALQGKKKALPIIGKMKLFK